MTDQVKEQISALVDDALPPQERSLLLARMVSDPALRETWSRYTLIQDALRNHLPEQVEPDLSDRVMAALEPESAHDRGAARPRLAGWTRPLAGLAVAASVAVLAVVMFQPDAPTPGGGVQVADAGSAPVAEDYRRVDTSQWQGQQAMVSERLNQYLVNHNEFAARNGMPVVAPHVRIVGYDREQH
ncbi:anti-sigma-E factor RseA [Thiohalobacter sp. COW1]|uniref:Negative regulatory protein n=1 Tax=Thiohalobacter thiocyanaticus TaxID=585455 RepID=A0A1Z4VPC7_9GAMM|nr:MULTISPECIES: sigma-E factor negative regulatory protein [Thiohalobacter]BAZ93461.1 negative regulatory protein [Thiohalobacter thiocyanaticus]BCO31497.1 anti-sigma-E factor RseA [Thiohalobacter sp. COW1]